MRESHFLHKLFPTSLYIADVEDSVKLNATILPHIYEMREHDFSSIDDPELLSTFVNEGWTSFFSRPGHGLIDESWTQHFQRIVLRHVEQFANMLQLDFGKRKPRVSTLFANIHEELYHRHDTHTHPGSMFSGAYYVRSYPGAGKLRVTNPAQRLQFHEFAHREESELNVDEVALECIAGRIVIFQSHVHSVDRPSARGDRVAMAFNVNYN